METEKVLSSVKKMMPIFTVDEEPVGATGATGIDITGVDDYYDAQLIMHINSALMVLCEMGAGPSTPVFITKDTTWGDLGFTVPVEMLQQFVVLRTQLMFDPPSNAFIVEAINEQIKELTWRITSFAEINSEGGYYE